MHQVLVLRVVIRENNESRKYMKEPYRKYQRKKDIDDTDAGETPDTMGYQIKGFCRKSRLSFELPLRLATNVLTC